MFEYPISNDEQSELTRLNTISLGLEGYINEINHTGMSRSRGVALEAMAPGVLEGYNMNAFTELPSRSRMNVALEAISLKQAGIIATAIVAGAAILAKFFKWLKDVFLDWLEKRSNKTVDHKRTNDAVKSAASKAKPVEPTEEQSKNVGIKKYVYPGAHIANATIIKLVERCEQEKTSEREISEAVTRLKTAVTRLNISEYEPAGLIVLHALATSRNLKLLAAPVLDMKQKGVPRYSGAWVHDVSTSVNAISTILNACDGVVRAIGSARGANELAVAMGNLETRMAEYTQSANSFDSVICVRAALAYNANEEMESLPSSYTAELNHDYNSLHDFAADNNPRTVSFVTEPGSDYVPLADYREFYNALCDDRERKSLYDFMNFNKKNASGVTSLTKSLKESNNRLQDLTSKLKTQMHKQTALMEVEYRMNASDGKYCTQPSKQVLRAINLLNAVIPKLFTVLTTMRSMVASAQQWDKALYIAANEVSEEMDKFDA